jgi:hypothetical protein
VIPIITVFQGPTDLIIGYLKNGSQSWQIVFLVWGTVSLLFSFYTFMCYNRPDWIRNTEHNSWFDWMIIFHISLKQLSFTGKHGRRKRARQEHNLGTVSSMKHSLSLVKEEMEYCLRVCIFNCLVLYDLVGMSVPSLTLKIIVKLLTLLVIAWSIFENINLFMAN